MGNTLTTEVFRDKLYETFPLNYRLDDEAVDYALKRYINALSEGGLNEVLNDVNGILALVDPDKIPTKYLPLLFNQYGFQYFNGIPEVYLRKMLPLISDLQDKKGSIVAVDYLTSIVSGIRPIIETDNETKVLSIKLELSDDLGDTPSAEQLRRIVAEYVPFFFTVMVVYAYVFEDSIRIKASDYVEPYKLLYKDSEVGLLSMTDTLESSTSGESLAENPTISFSLKTMDSLLNTSYNQLGDNFIYTNSISGYDKVTNTNTNTSEFKFTTE